MCWNNLRGSYFKAGSKLRNLWPGQCEPPSPTVAPFAWHTYNEKMVILTVRLIRQDDRFQEAGQILHKRGKRGSKPNEVLRYFAGCMILNLHPAKTWYQPKLPFQQTHQHQKSYMARGHREVGWAPSGFCRATLSILYTLVVIVSHT